MKTYTIIVISSVVIGVAAVVFFKTYDGSVTVQNNEKTVEVAKEVKVDLLESQIKDAISASSTAIEARAQKAYDDAKHQAELEIELEVRTQYVAEQDAKVKELQKESIAY